jgi:hypothetical protein
MCIGGTRNLRVNMLIVNCELDIAVFSCKAKPLETLPALAVRVTAWADVNDDTVAVNPALVALAGTTSVAGTVTAALLLVRMTYVSDSLAENVDCFQVAVVTCKHCVLGAVFRGLRSISNKCGFETQSEGCY